MEKSDFDCICCGVCCSKFQARLSPTEARTLAKVLSLEWPRFLAQFVDLRWPSEFSFLLKHVGGACVFLERQKSSGKRLCSIYALRPACCSGWEAGLDKPECREGIQAAGA